MNIDEYKKQYDEHFQALLANGRQILQDVFKHEFGIEYDIPETQQTIPDFTDGVYPVIKIHFSAAGDAPGEHEIYLPAGFVATLISWAKEEDLQEELNESDLNYFSNLVQQILDGLNDSSFEDLGIDLINNKDELSANIEGLIVRIEVASGESYPVYHVFKSQEPIGEEEEMVDIHPADFEPFPQTKNGNGLSQNMDMLLDVQLKILVELGKKTMQISDILKLGKGSVVELDKAAGEPLDIFVNDKKFAVGEVVVVDDHFGIRITKLAGLNERMKKIV